MLSYFTPSCTATRCVVVSSSVMGLGMSQPWPEVVRVTTQGQTSCLDPQPMLSYFTPSCTAIRCAVISSSVMGLGMSQPWPEVVRVATQGQTSRLDPQPMLSYFAPLMAWLQRQNRDEYPVGWFTSPSDTGEYLILGLDRIILD
jgi:hypothetical protein